MIIEVKIRNLVTDYADVIDECRGDVPLHLLFAGGLENYPELDQNHDVAWMVGWLEGVATAAGMLPETLIENCRKAKKERKK